MIIKMKMSNFSQIMSAIRSLADSYDTEIRVSHEENDNFLTVSSIEGNKEVLIQEPFSATNDKGEVIQNFQFESSAKGFEYLNDDFEINEENIPEEDRIIEFDPFDMNW